MVKDFLFADIDFRKFFELRENNKSRGHSKAIINAVAVFISLKASLTIGIDL